jgi:hypothetical protein
MKSMLPVNIWTRHVGVKELVTNASGYFVRQQPALNKFTRREFRNYTDPGIVRFWGRIKPWRSQTPVNRAINTTTGVL